MKKLIMVIAAMGTLWAVPSYAQIGIGVGPVGVRIGERGYYRDHRPYVRRWDRPRYRAWDRPRYRAWDRPRYGERRFIRRERAW